VPHFSGAGFSFFGARDERLPIAVYAAKPIAWNPAMTERVASCQCGKVRFRAVGRPIVASVCYCDDCQAGAHRLEAMGAAGSFHDQWFGTPYLTYRDGALACLEGGELLEGVKLRENAPTTRYIASCCKSPVYLKYAPGWWTSMYRAGFSDAPPLEFRSSTQFVAAGSKLPDDVPVYRRFPMKLFARLFAAGIAQLLRANAQ
jgi:hypothetical protein